MTRMMEQQQTLPQHLPLPPCINAPACSSDLHILSPSFLGICPSAAIWAAMDPRVTGFICFSPWPQSSFVAPPLYAVLW